MQIVLFEPLQRNRFLPLVFTHAFSELRMGIFTFKERWEKYLKATCLILAPTYLEINQKIEKKADFLYINPQFLPNLELIQAIEKLGENEALKKDTDIIAGRMAKSVKNSQEIYEYIFSKTFEYTAKLNKIEYIWDLLTHNSACIEQDFTLLPAKNNSKSFPTCQFLGNNIYIEEGASILCSTLNSTTGSIYIGKNAVVMEGSCIRGPFVLQAHAELKMGAKIYGGTTIGPYSKIGGEVNHSIIQGFSNKGHEGFLGSSLLGSWCNLGAATNNSNLKNNYKTVDIYDYETRNYVSSKLQFLGLIMGEHSRTGIGTLFNTGTVAGIHNNIFGSDFQDKYIPSFSWGSKNDRKDYLFDKAMETAESVMQRRNVVLDEKTKKIYQYLYKHKESSTFGTNFA